MVVREMGRRCTYNASKIAEVDAMLGLAGGHSMVRKDDLSLLRLLALFDGTGFMSLRIVEHLDPKNLGHLDSQARHVLQTIINQLPEKSFDLVCIHQWWM